jgi:alpha,alpha-trehalase
MVQKEIFQLDPLFDRVQMQQIFEDGKVFVDCVPLEPTSIILEKYLQQKDIPGFDLKTFVHTHFELPKVFASNYSTDVHQPVEAHINNLWHVLTRAPDEKKGALIPLPHPYIVPGGRFGEVYYWDSYFTMLGLQAAGNIDMIENMVGNFSHLINTIGFIPNGNRTYYLGRSQPPFYSLMVQLLASIKGDVVITDLLSTLVQEYTYWMKDADVLTTANNSYRHVVLMKDGSVLNRYCDAFDTARPESYKEDVALSHQSLQPATTLYKHLRAGAESGWDYSSRWLKDGASFTTIHTADIIPVDLNCLLYHLEQTIATGYEIKKDRHNYQHYNHLAEKRKMAIQKYCWSNAAGFFVDYDFVEGHQKLTLTLAGMVPLYFKIADQVQADLTAEIIQAQFLKPGGLVTSLQQTGQQWDAPNGWAPLQWMSVLGLNNYGHHSIAKKIAERWIQLNTAVFKRTGKMMEKYNVIETHLEAGGGEYTGQDGFGWTNGVFLAMQAWLKKN